MALLRNGHQRVYEYGYSMFNQANEELKAHEATALVNTAFAHRVSKATDEKWKEFVSKTLPKPTKTQATQSKKKPKKTMTKDEHLAVIRRIKGLG